MTPLLLDYISIAISLPTCCPGSEGEEGEVKETVRKNKNKFLSRLFVEVVQRRPKLGGFFQK